MLTSTIVFHYKFANRKNTILVRDGNQDIVDIIGTWANKESIDESMIEKWSDEGLAFWLTPQGTRTIYNAENKNYKNPEPIHKPSTLKYAADLYIEAKGDKDEKIYVKSTRRSAVKDLHDGSLSLDYLIRRGEAFTNTSKIMIEEQVLNRAGGIATRMQNEFPMDSPEWKRWTDRTDQYNATSLTQVMAEYFQDQSIGDVGGPNSQYVPRAGYPGTLAPGEKFLDNYALEDLPHKVLHPWPAMQQFQYHVRWPPTHPMLPPPLLWFGLNNMYTSNFTQSLLDEDCDRIVGGTLMTPKDAIRIAKFHKLGASYEESEQIPHGGSLFSGGFKIPHYNPDHGPTIPKEDTEPPFPDFLLPITNRWMDPFRGLNVSTIKTSAELETDEEIMVEEQIRRLAAERLTRFTQNQDSEIDDDKEIRQTADDLAKILRHRGKALVQPQIDGSDTSSQKEINEEVSVYDKETLAMAEKIIAEREVDRAQRLATAISGKARSARALISYSIETVRDLRTEVERVERDQATRKKGGRRRQRKKTTDGTSS
mgnify:CR=1 FL=1